MFEPAHSALRAVGRRAAGVSTSRWPAASRLFLVGENSGWVIDHELRAVSDCACTLGIRVAPQRLLRAARAQAAFYGSQFTLLVGPWDPPPHRLGVAYFHGRPGTPGMPEFDECFETLRARHREIERVQVSHSEIEAIVLSTGIDRAKVHRIPIGLEPTYFSAQTPELRAAARERLGLADDAFVVGSFHKDGVGWGEGEEAKWIKGPDVLVETLRLVRSEVPQLQVLLSGPARGWVKRRLEEHGIPYVHRVLDDYAAIGELYHALDAYLVPSRQEGGPKGVLEAMASGVPLVTTRVGQAMDLVRDGENGWLVDVDDTDALAQRLLELARSGAPAAVVVRARETAASNTYAAQLPLWRAFFDGFVELR